jgi:polar amino acid transport system substrate-binding protein
MHRLLRFAFLSLPGASVLAQTVPLVTGEYPPYVSNVPTQHGVAYDLVAAAMTASGINASFSFLPWARAQAMTEQGRFIAAFPYIKTPEREQKLLYSDTLISARQVYWIAADSPHPLNWRNKSVCVPVGYDISRFGPWQAQYQLKLERPIDAKSCFQMLLSHRVDIVPMDEWVGQFISNQLMAGKRIRYELPSAPIRIDEYHLVVARTLPGAAQWIARINRGLAIIRQNGSYERILSRDRIANLKH